MFCLLALGALLADGGSVTGSLSLAASEYECRYEPLCHTVLVAPYGRWHDVDWHVWGWHMYR